MKSLIRRNDVELADPFRAFEGWMDELWRNWPGRAFQTDPTRPMFSPAMDVIENDNDVTIRLDLPGLTSDDVNVELEDHTLTISGEIGDTVEKEGDHFHYRERYTGSFRRSLRLPNTIDAEHVDASFTNGVLNIVLPKRPEAQPKRITIKSGKGK